jgi:hypothetical protein
MRKQVSKDRAERNTSTQKKKVTNLNKNSFTICTNFLKAGLQTTDKNIARNICKFLLENLVRRKKLASWKHRRKDKIDAGCGETWSEGNFEFITTVMIKSISSRMWRPGLLWQDNYDSEVYAICIFRLTFFWVVTLCNVVVRYQNSRGPWCLRLRVKMRQYGPLKLWYPTTNIHCVKSKKTSTRKWRIELDWTGSLQHWMCEILWRL